MRDTEYAETKYSCSSGLGLVSHKVGGTLPSGKYLRSTETTN